MNLADPAIHITRWGDRGPVVVLVHGSAQGSEVGGDRHFSAQARLAGRGWRVVVPDRPGHGRSPAPGRPDDAEADGRWVADLLGEGAHLVGHSFGACVALAAATMRPLAVRSLTLIEPSMRPLSMDDPHVRQHVERQKEIFAGTASPAELAIQFAKHTGIPAGLTGGSGPDALARKGLGVQGLKMPSAAMLRDGLALVARSGIPLLVVSGGWNRAFEANADAVARLGGGRRIVIRSEHHFTQLEADAFNDVLAEFMSGADSR